MKVTTFIRVFDYKDTSEKPLILRDVNLGTYKNDVFSKWFMTSEIVVADFEMYFCARLKEVVGFPVLTSDDIVRADNLLKHIKGYGIAEWLNDLMISETDFDLLERELKNYEEE